jgi:hypothetical protein
MDNIIDSGRRLIDRKETAAYALAIRRFITGSRHVLPLHVLPGARLDIGGIQLFRKYGYLRCRVILSGPSRVEFHDDIQISLNHLSPYLSYQQGGMA